MVYRDFRDETKQKLLQTVKRLTPSDDWWSRAADSIGDVADKVGTWVIGLDVGDTAQSYDKYMNRVIDQNNMSAQQIEEIWTKVGSTNDSYATRFVAVKEDLKGLRQQVMALADIVSPGSGKFDAGQIRKGTLNDINQFLETHKVLSKLTEKGLTQQDLQELNNQNPAMLKHVLDVLGSSMLDMTPGLSLGDSISIPIGPNVSFTYWVKMVDGGKGPVGIDLSDYIAGQKRSLADMASVTAKTGSIKLDEFGHPVNEPFLKPGDTEWSSSTAMQGSQVTTTWTRKYDGSSQAYSVNSDYRKREAGVSYETGGDLGICSGIGFTVKQNGSWRPLTRPLPVSETYPLRLPELTLPTWKGIVPEPVNNLIVGTGLVALSLLALLAGAALAIA